MIYLENPIVSIVFIIVSTVIYVLVSITGYKKIYPRTYRVVNPLIEFISRGSNIKKPLLPLILSILFLSILAIGLGQPYIIVYEKVSAIEKGVGTLSFSVKPPVILVLDVSGSMEGEKIIEAKKALKTFIHEINGSLDIGLIAFDGSVVESIPPSNDTDYIIERIDSLEAGGGTMYSYPLTIAYNMLKPYREFDIPVSIVFASDGLPADPGKARSIIDEYYVPEKIKIYGIFIGNEPEGYLVIQEMSNKTGGQPFLVKDIGKLVETYRELAREIKNTTLSNITIRLKHEKIIEKKNYLTNYFLIASLLILLTTYYVNYKRYGLTF